MSQFNMLEKICTKTRLREDVVREVVGDVLEELHKAALFHDKGSTGMLMESCWNFGEKAIFHLGGILYKSNIETSGESLVTETLQRFIGCENEQFNAVKNEWINIIEQHKKSKM